MHQKKEAALSTSEKEMSDRLRQALGASSTSKSPPLFAKLDPLEEQGSSAITFTQEDVDLMVRTARGMQLMHFTRVTAAHELQHGLRSFAKVRAESANAPPAEQQLVEKFLQEESLLLVDRLHGLVAQIDEHVGREVLFPKPPPIKDVTPRRREEDPYWTAERVKGILLLVTIVGAYVILLRYTLFSCLAPLDIALGAGLIWFIVGASS